MPQTLADLKDHDLVLFGEGAAPVATVNWLAELLQKNNVTSRVALRVNNIYGIYRAVKAGIGIGSLPEYFIKEGSGIVQILPEVEGPLVDAYFVYPEELRNSARVAVFRDYLVREIARARSQLTMVAQTSDVADNRPARAVLASDPKFYVAFRPPGNVRTRYALHAWGNGTIAVVARPGHATL